MGWFRLAAWLLWSELQSISVAVGLAIFGLVLFELGTWGSRGSFACKRTRR